jgi:hypothetical protein
MPVFLFVEAILPKFCRISDLVQKHGLTRQAYSLAIVSGRLRAARVDGKWVVAQGDFESWWRNRGKRKAQA